MATYRVTVSYTVDGVDEEALLRAGTAAWGDVGDGWAVGVGADGSVEEISHEEAAGEVPGPEASLSFVLAAQPYPSVPGVQFAGSGVTAVRDDVR